MEKPDHSRFEELAALSAGGFLSGEELDELRQHEESCEWCKQVEAEFIEVVHSGLPLTQGPIQEFLDRTRHKPEKGVRERFLQRAKREGIVLSQAANLPFEVRKPRVGFAIAFFGAGVAAAAVALMVFNPQFVNRPPTVPPSLAQMEDLRKENSELKAKLQERQSAVPAVTPLQPDVESLRQELRAALKTAEDGTKQVDQLRAQAQEENATNTQLLADIQTRDRLLAETKSELARLDGKRGEDQASTVAMQTRINELSEQLRATNANLDMERQLLAQGKEIRDLMGARQLHVVDVRDTDSTGKQGKAFGRVFLTEGKSLIFYAFDLNDTKLADSKHSFQVWGQEDGKPGSVHSLGFLLVDNKAQRRWALKVDDPKLVSEIDSVFVTVESASGGRKPSGQRMLYAYLGEANHP